MVTFIFFVYISVPLLVLITFLPLNSPPRLTSADEKKELGLGLYFLQLTKNTLVCMVAIWWVNLEVLQRVMQD